MPRNITLLNRCLHSLDDTLSPAHRSTVFVIVVIGFMLRWYSLQVGHAYTYFAIKDEITALQYAFGFMHGNPLTYYLGSPALNQGQIPGPLWAMFVAALYKLSGNSIEGAIFLMIIFNTLTIYLVYRLAAQMMAPRYALFSALSYSLAPWVIYYSAGLYNPMVLAFFGVLLYLALWHTLNHDRSRKIFWVAVISAAIPQFHMIGIFYYPAILLLLTLNPYRINYRWLIAGVFIGTLLYVPYLIGEINHHWSNLHKVLQGEDGFSSGVLKVITIPIAMLTNHPGEWPGYTMGEFMEFGNQWFGSYYVLIIINLISIFFALLFVGGFIKRFFVKLRAHRFNLFAIAENERPYLFIGILLIFPLLLYILTGKAYTTRYSIIIYPILFLLPALYISNIENKCFKRAVLYTISIMFIFNIYLVLSFYTDQNRKITSSTQFIPAFDKLEKFYSAMRKDAGPDKSIEIDTSNFLDKDDKYRDIVVNSIRSFIALHQRNAHSDRALNTTFRVSLVNTPKKVPDGARIIYRDNGLIVYTR